MKPRYLLGIVVAALGIALAKAWLSPSTPQDAAREEPAPGPSVSFDQLYPEAAEAALKQRAEQQK